MSVRWIAVQYVGDTLRLPIVDNDTMDKPFGSTVLERPISKIVVNPFSEKPRTFVEKREYLDSGSAIEMLRTFLTMSPSVVYPDEVLEHLQAVEDEVCEVCRSFEDSVEYLRQENIDWEDRYRELAEENAKLQRARQTAVDDALSIAEMMINARADKDRIESENVKLRGLVRDWYELAVGGSDSLTDWNHAQSDLEQRMRELGVEVDE